MGQPKTYRKSIRSEISFRSTWQASWDFGPNTSASMVNNNANVCIRKGSEYRVASYHRKFKSKMIRIEFVIPWKTMVLRLLDEAVEDQ